MMSLPRQSLRALAEFVWQNIVDIESNGTVPRDVLVLRLREQCSAAESSAHSHVISTLFSLFEALPQDNTIDATEFVNLVCENFALNHKDEETDLCPDEELEESVSADSCSDFHDLHTPSQDPHLFVSSVFENLEADEPIEDVLGSGGGAILRNAVKAKVRELLESTYKRHARQLDELQNEVSRRGVLLQNTIAEHEQQCEQIERQADARVADAEERVRVAELERDRLRVLYAEAQQKAHRFSQLSADSADAFSQANRQNTSLRGEVRELRHELQRSRQSQRRQLQHRGTSTRENTPTVITGSVPSLATETASEISFTDFDVDASASESQSNMSEDRRRAPSTRMEEQHMRVVAGLAEEMDDMRRQISEWRDYALALQAALDVRTGTVSDRSSAIMAESNNHTTLNAANFQQRLRAFQKIEQSRERSESRDGKSSDSSFSKVNVALSPATTRTCFSSDLDDVNDARDLERKPQLTERYTGTQTGNKLKSQSPGRISRKSWFKRWLSAY
ncbi:MAG: hypothetical protein MHM6MM_006314 [Cercozoa sp. M6MM]